MPRRVGTSLARVVIPVLLCAFALSAASGTTGCATATNYLDPAGPVYRGAAAQPAGPAHGSIRLVTFNIEYARHVDRAIAALRAHPALHDADILTLQEMDAPGVEAIARALHLNYVYYPISLHPRAGHDFGNAVLSRWPIEESRKLLLPHLSRVRHQARAAVVARIRIAEEIVHVYSVHLGAPFTTGGAARRDQAAALLTDARDMAGPVIIAGDLNSHAVGEQFERNGFAWPTKDLGPTVRRFSFDHVFVRGLPLRDAVAGVARDVKDASDHRPVWIRLRLGPLPQRLGRILPPHTFSELRQSRPRPVAGVRSSRAPTGSNVREEPPDLTAIPGVLLVVRADPRSPGQEGVDAAARLDHRRGAPA